MVLAAALTLGVGLAGPLSAPVAAEVASVAQDPGGTVTSPSAEEPAAPAVADEEGALDNADEVAAENRRIWLVVGALLAVALALLILTIRYWRQTKPVVAAVEPVATAGDEPPADPERSRGRRSRRSVAGADHATADSTWEPRGTGQHERIEPVPANQRKRISRDQRRAAYEAGRR